MKNLFSILIIASIIVCCKKPLEFNMINDNPHIEHAINDESITLFHENFVSDSDEFNELVDRATDLSSDGRYNKARKVFDKAMTIDPNDPVLLNNYGNLEHSDKNFSKAISYFKKSIETSDKKYLVAYINLGKTYGLIGETENAKEAYFYVLNNTEIPYLKGVTYLHLSQFHLDYGNKDEGLETVLKAKQLLRGNPYFETLIDTLENRLIEYN
jgi:tetratricopeptide (TPR) repeat protein